MWDEAPSPVAAGSAVAGAFSLHFGGPDQPPRALRDLLKARIEAAPPGSEITWATYYFRDLDLAHALVAAHRRGVRVRVLLDARPRRDAANDAVIDALHHGIGDDLRLHRAWLPGSRLHTKIYAFSGPRPEVFIGSFNPSGNAPEDPDVTADIGDQDRGHNLLISFRHPPDARALTARASRLWAGRGLSRFNRTQNQPLRLSLAGLFFFPRLNADVVAEDLTGLGPRDRIRGAVSHLDYGPFSRRLVEAAQAGADVELVVHDTHRRVPPRVVADLAAAGVSIQRYCHPQGLPMHAKFVLVEKAGRRSAWFGSLNYNMSSQVLNHEILARTEQPGLVAALAARFRVIAREAEAQVWACPAPGPDVPAPGLRQAANERVTASGRLPWPD